MQLQCNHYSNIRTDNHVKCKFSENEFNAFKRTHIKIIAVYVTNKY